MQSSFIIAIAIIIAIVIVVVIVLVIAFTNSTTVDAPTSGTDSVGKWVRVGTSSGPLKSYLAEGIFANPDGETLTIVGDRIVLKPAGIFGGIDTYWVFDGLFLSSNGYYFNVDGGSGTPFLSTFPQTALLFDNYNFYLTSSIYAPKAKVIDPLTLKVQETTSGQIYQPTVNRWTVNQRN